MKQIMADVIGAIAKQKSSPEESHMKRIFESNDFAYSHTA